MDIVPLIMTTMCWREHYRETARVRAGTVDKLPGDIRGVVSRIHAVTNRFAHP